MDGLSLKIDGFRPVKFYFKKYELENHIHGVLFGSTRTSKEKPTQCE